MLRRTLAASMIWAALATASMAQDGSSLADIKQDISVLNSELLKLRTELSTTGASNVNVSGLNLLDRVNAIEAELVRLTSKTEEMEYRINKVVSDGTNRLGDLEFRVTELEGGDLGSVGETRPLGETATAPQPEPTQTAAVDNGSLAVGEQADFRRASEALAKGDFRTAADLFTAFGQTYQGGPLNPEADLLRGKALEGLGDTREAARAYLQSYSQDKEGPHAPEALLKLGSALSGLGQNEAACKTFAQIGVLFPSAGQVLEAQANQRNLGCS